MWIVFWANILLIIALILLPDVSLYYSPEENDSIIIEYLVFQFIPTKNKNKKRKTKDKRILFSLVLDLIQYAKIKVKGDVETRLSSSALATFLTLPFLFTKISLMAFLKSYAKSASVEEVLDNNALIEIKIPLLRLIIFLFKYPYYIRKDKYRRVKNER